MLLYAVTIFVSAFLLFLVQPVMAKQILPWFGGSAAVWTTCLVFFQTDAARRLRVRRLDGAPARAARAQVKLHIALLVVSLAVLPIIPGARWKPAGDENPSWLILGLLAATIGLPYFLLSTTSPLVQAWFARALPGREPVPAVRAVEPRVDARAARLSVPARAVGRRRARRRGAGRPATRSSSRCAPPRRWSSLARAGAAPSPRGPAQARRPPHATSRRAAADGRAPAALVHARRDGLGPAARRVEPHHAEHRVGAAAVDRAARALSAHVHPRASTAPAGTSATSSCRWLAAALGVMAWTLADSEPHARARDPGRRVLHRPLPRLHVLPRRARAAEARAALSDALLPDDLARRRARRGRSSASSRRWCCPPTSSSPAGSRCARCCCSGRCGATTPVFGVLGARRAVHDDRLRDLGRHASSTTNAISAVAQLLRRAARAGGRHGDAPATAAAWSTARSCTATSTCDPTLAHAADDLLHGHVRHRPRCSTCCTRGIEPLRSASSASAPARSPSTGARATSTASTTSTRTSSTVAQARLHLPARQRRDDRDARSATRGWCSSASRRRTSTCSRSTRSRATRSRCT